MHISFDKDGIEVKDVFEPKKNIDSTPKENDDDLNFGFAENEVKKEVKDDFFGGSSETNPKDDFFASKTEEKKKEVSINHMNTSSIDLKPLESKIDELKVGLGILKDRDIGKVVNENINLEFEKLKSQIKVQSEDIKGNLDEIKTSISNISNISNVSKAKNDSDVKNELIEDEKDSKKAILSKKASTDSLFRVIFFMIILTLAAVIYFGLTIMEDLTKHGSSTKIIERIVPASPQTTKTSQNAEKVKVDTSMFENEAKAIKSEIANLNQSISEFKNLLNEIKAQEPKTTTIMPVSPTPSVPIQKEVIKEVKFDDKNINQRLNSLSNQLNELNSKLSKISANISENKKEFINKMDRVEDNLKNKIDTKATKQVKTYSDGLQLRDE